MSESLNDLRALPDDELARRHDSHARNTAVGTRHYLDELNRRDQERQTKAMLDLTKSINRMTVVITIATILGAGISTAMLVLML